jgi:hypothetical protein
MKEKLSRAEARWQRFTHNKVANVIAVVFLLAIATNVALDGVLRATPTPAVSNQPSPAIVASPVESDADDDPSPVTEPVVGQSRRERFQQEWSEWSEAEQAEICWAFTTASVEQLNELREDHHAIFSVLLVECTDG